MTKAEEFASKYVAQAHSPSDMSDAQAAMNIAVWKGCVAAYEQAERDYESIIRRIKNTLRGADYMRAYRDAKKDFALTPKDVSKIFNKVRELQVKYPATAACFEEVAEWFNKLKEEKK